MRIKVLEEARVVCSNKNSIHNYFAWPTVAKLQDGTLAFVASGFRMRHVCPFGKVVICYSRNQGKTWSPPAVLIDTPLDDRDSGILPYGEKSVIVTSFNDTIREQRDWAKNHSMSADNPYIYAYLDRVESEGLEAPYFGSTYVLSNDGGYTFGDVRFCGVSTPHGPACLNDGRVIYIGRIWNRALAESSSSSAAGSPDSGIRDIIECHVLNDNGIFEYLSEIDEIFVDGRKMLSCEPHAVVLPNGKILVHIRVEDYIRGGFMSIYQSESYDDGKTFTKPHQLLERGEGAPSHILRHSSGKLIATYGHRLDPVGIRAMVSCDNGETWETGLTVCNTLAGNDDIGYPSSIELEDGSILTIFYAHRGTETASLYAHRGCDIPSEIMQIVWKLED